MSSHRPLYARMLRLKFLTPSGFLCFVFFEGAVALGILLALAELVSWWGVIVLPLTVAIMVKLNDAIAASLTPATVAAAAGSRPPMEARPSAGAQPPAGIQPPDRERPPVEAQPADWARPPFGVQSPDWGRPPFGVQSADWGRPPVEHASAAWEERGLGGEATKRLPGVISREGGAPIKRPWVERAEAQQQWIRQSATRRYE